VEVKQTTTKMKSMKSTKNMLVAALAAGVLLAGGSSVFAQDSTNKPAGGPPAGERGPGMRAGHPDFAKMLDLTDEQKPKVEAIMKGAMEKRQALRTDSSLTPEDKKAKAKAIQEDTATQMKAVLTPEQFAKWHKMSQGMRGNRPPGGGAGGEHPAPPAGDKPPQN
jgi:periplasmic protein CpxP/Spy